MDSWLRVVLCSVAILVCIPQRGVRAAKVIVDLNAGNDTECSSLQQLQTNSSQVQVPCKTINRALGNVECSRNCENYDPLYNSTVAISDGVHTLQGCISILQGDNVTIEAQNTGMATVKCSTFRNYDSEVYDGIESCQTNGLVFRGINFEGCGPRSSNVFINRSTDVLFEDCIFRENVGAPLQLQFVPTVVLLRTDFILNKNEIPAPLDTENTTISDVIGSIITAGGFTYYNRDSENVSIIIDQCKFINNKANTNDGPTIRPLLLKGNGHGGAIIIRLLGVSEADIQITNSLFDGNEAEVNGGGIYFSTSENFYSSNVYLYNNTFIHNRAYSSSGGAISWNTFSSSFNNSLVVNDCRFVSNQGSAGGAVSIGLHTTSFQLIPDRASFSDCLFYNNKANVEGTAVGLFALVRVEEFGFPVEFTNCNFTANHRNLQEDTYHSSKNREMHTSALLVFRFPIEFRGYNHFVDNVGGGIILLNAQMNVSGELLLLNNKAMFGAGIAMDDTCLIEVSPGVRMDFINNTATMSGGGIHATIPAIRYTSPVFNRFCFLQYNSPTGTDVPPSQWENVSINFVGNQAQQSGAAIFASDLRLCNWIGNEYTDQSDYNIFGDQPVEIAALSPFHFDDNMVLEDGNQVNIDLATAPDRIIVSPMLELNIVQPGEELFMDILCIDQVNNSREAIWSLESTQEEQTLDGISSGNEIFSYQIPQARLLFENIQVCSDNTTGRVMLNFSLPKTLSEPTTISLDINGCHPGYIMNSDTCLCQCNSADDTEIVRCDEYNRYIYLQNGVWGDLNEDRQLIIGYPPQNFLYCEKEGRLPGCLFKWDNSSAQCKPGRHGRLCGVCDENYGITLDLQACSKADDGCILGLSLFIILCFVVIILSFLVLFFDIGLPNELKGLFFYLQVIGLVYRPFLILTNTSSPLSILTNLMGFSIPIPLCISTHLQAQHIALLGYIPPILMLSSVVAYIICVRFIKALSNRSSLNGITLLSLLIYKHIADTSFNLISCSSTSTGLIFTYNGSVDCISLEFGFIFFLGLLLTVLFIGPAPFAVAYICVKRPTRFQQYADVLTKDLHASRRWFGGWDIGRRLPIVFFSYIAMLPSVALFLLSISATGVLLVHLLVQPYEKRHVNIIESLVLINLVAVAIIFLSSSSGQVPTWFSTFLLLIPYLYGILYFISVLIFYIYQRYHGKLLESNENMKDLNIPLGSKRLEIGVGKMSIRVSNVSTGQDITNSVIQSDRSPNETELYTEKNYRESVLEL